MRGLGSAGLRIPVERANLSPGDFAPRAARRPSPGFHPLPCTPEGAAGVNFFAGGASTWAVELTWTSYKGMPPVRVRKEVFRAKLGQEFTHPKRAESHQTPVGPLLWILEAFHRKTEEVPPGAVDLSGMPGKLAQIAHDDVDFSLLRSHPG